MSTMGEEEEMSGGSLPKTGIGAITVGGVAGVGAYQLPLPVFLAVIGVVTVLAGAFMIRVGFRRRRPVGR